MRESRRPFQFYRRTAFVEQLERRDYLAADLVSQWRAEDLVGSMADGATVQQWPDAVKGLAAVGSGSPQLVHGAVGGRAAIRFNASDGTDLLRIDRLQNPLSGAGDFSVVLVFRSSSTELQGADAEWFKNSALVDSNSLGVTTDWGISVNASGSVAVGMGRGFGTPTTNIYSTQSRLNNGEWHSVIVRRAADQLSLSIDDAAPIQVAAHSLPLASLDLVFGGQKFGTLGYTGDVAEVQVYSGALDDGQLQAVRNELLAYYSNSRPVGNPDFYTVEEDPVLFVQPAATGVLANDRDADGDALRAVLVESTKHGTLVLNPDGSFIYDSVNDFFGTDTFVYTAHDHAASDPTTVTIEVTPTYDPASARPDRYRTVPRQRLEVLSADGLLANDANPDRVTLRVELVDPISHGILQLNPDGSFIYDANGFAGEARFSYRIFDGVRNSGSAEVVILSNSPPVGVSDAYSLDEDSFYRSVRSVLSNDQDADRQPLEAILVTAPSRGEFELFADGTFTYRAPLDETGVVEFSYRVRDGYDLSEPVVVQLNVLPVNDRPIAVEDRYVGLPDQPLQIDAGEGLLANDRDVDDLQLTVTVLGGPDHGSLDVQADGSFVYRPRPGFVGADGFSYQASDGRLSSESVRVELTITQTPIRISEILAANASLLPTRTRHSADVAFSGPMTTPDWIELENLTTQPIDLGGMHLTDDERLPQKWTFPAGTVLPGGGYLVVYASELNLLDRSLDEAGRLHTNFSLSRSGEYLALTFRDGTPISAWSPQYPVQRTDVSYGTHQGRAQYFVTPTPASANVQAGIEQVVEEIEFSVLRGFYQEPFQLALSSVTPGATLVYTTDGSEPTLQNGQHIEPPDPLSGPRIQLLIDKTTVLRARAYREGFLSTNVGTQSYFFVADVVTQSTLSNTIKNHATWGPQLDDALLALPSVSIVSGSRFSEREVGASMEFIHPDGTVGFQVDAGLEYFGGTSLSSSPKKSMRLSFKSKWGAGSLQHDLFGDGAVDTFEQLLLRSGSHDTWLWTHPGGGRGNFLRNRWAYDRQLEMGQLAPHSRFVHVYVNGRYWGLHELMERPEADFMESYDGGWASDYDVLNAGQAVDGTVENWRRIGRNEIIDNYEELQKWVNLENYADYMLLQFYAGNDWDWNLEQNWMAAGRRVGDPRFIFFSWDSDVMLRTTATANVINRGGPSNLWNMNGGIKQHPEFLLMMADRAQRYFFDDGMFTDDRLRADFEALAEEIRLPMIAESARWGGSGYTPNTWESAVTWMLDRFAPEGPGSRAETVISQLRRAGIYPSTDAPRFLVNGTATHSMALSPTDQLMVATANGDIYYTLDGTDPRLPGGAISGSAVRATGPIELTRSAKLLARTLQGGVWSALVEGLFLVNTVPADGSNLRISEIHYHPADPSPAELAAGFGDGDEFEYLELVNVSSSVLDLRQVSLAQKTVNGQVEGVRFKFAGSSVEFLEPGSRLVVVENEAAFRVRYGQGPLVAGSWEGGLGNSGESLLLETNTGIIHDFVYSDRWYRETDGSGRSLQVVNERDLDLTNWSRSMNWRASRSLVGSPGRPDSLPGDVNDDGIFNSRDLVLVFIAGEYEDGVPKNSDWNDGDWNGDGDFTSADLVLAMMESGYSESPAAGVAASEEDLEAEELRRYVWF